MSWGPMERRDVGTALLDGTRRLRNGASPTARLDAEVLLAHVTGRDRAWVLAHPEASLDAEAAGALRTALDRRAAGEPIAYIRRVKEWQSLRTQTDPTARIPPPATEPPSQAR